MEEECTMMVFLIEEIRKEAFEDVNHVSRLSCIVSPSSNCCIGYSCTRYYDAYAYYQKSINKLSLC